MVDRQQLPYLLRLLEDDSPAVREHVTRELIAFGPSLEDALTEWDVTLTGKQRSVLRSLISARRREEVRREAWLRWPRLTADADQLEAAFQLLAEFQYGWVPPVRLNDLLDDLAEEFFTSGRPVEPVALSRFLFISKKLRGNSDDYYNPMNSNLISVLQTGKGLPISLAVVFMLVGRRVGIAIGGCNVPGHFLARAHVSGKDVLFDCFNGGRILSAREMAQLRSTLAPNHLHLLTENAEAPTIVSRVLHNLIRAYDQLEDLERSSGARGLLRDLLETTQG